MKTAQFIYITNSKDAIDVIAEKSHQIAITFVDLVMLVFVRIKIFLVVA
jgi:hypothetical protein